MQDLDCHVAAEPLTFRSQRFSPAAFAGFVHKTVVLEISTGFKPACIQKEDLHAVWQCLVTGAANYIRLVLESEGKSLTRIIREDSQRGGADGRGYAASLTGARPMAPQAALQQSCRPRQFVEEADGMVAIYAVHKLRPQ